MPELVRYNTSHGGTIVVNYNASNLRLTSVDWSFPVGVEGLALIFDENGGQLFSLTMTGNGSQNVAGNRRVVQVTDEHGTFYDFPAGFTHTLTIWSNHGQSG